MTINTLRNSLTPLHRGDSFLATLESHFVTSVKAILDTFDSSTYANSLRKIRIDPSHHFKKVLTEAQELRKMIAKVHEKIEAILCMQEEDEEERLSSDSFPGRQKSYEPMTEEKGQVGKVFLSLDQMGGVRMWRSFIQSLCSQLGG